MAVEASADERAVVVPRVTRVGRRVDGEHGEVARTYTVEDRGLVLGAPRRLADREERERAGVAQRGRVERTDIVDALRRKTLQLGDLRDADRGLVEHAVHTGGPVAIRRDLGDEEQPISHGANVRRSTGADIRWT